MFQVAGGLPRGASLERGDCCPLLPGDQNISALSPLTLEDVIRGNTELSVADVKELFISEPVNHSGPETQSSIKKNTHNILKPAAHFQVASAWPSLRQPP